MIILIALLAIVLLTLSNSVFSELFLFFPVDLYQLWEFFQRYIWLGIIFLVVIWIIGED